jgi:hypothetical protein
MPSKLKHYPTPQAKDCGCKVSWNGYTSEADAKPCSEAARHNGRILEAQGYDFGYQSPGEIRGPDNSANRLPGYYTVTLP